MPSIDHINLARLDLNLLVAFDALMAERSVTRAAGRIGLRQSAMSHNLARLRVLFGDELLTRGPEGMRPTPRASALIEPVRTALSQIETLVSDAREFDPKTEQRVFRIGLPDSMEVLLIPGLLAQLQQEAPGLRLRLNTMVDEEQILEDLDADRLDLAIGLGRFEHGQVHHKLKLLGKGTYLCMFNARLVDAAPPITLQDYVRFPHVLTSLRQGERGIVDDALAKLGLDRKVVLTTPRFLAVPYLVLGAPVVTTMHAQLARRFAQALGLTLSPAPVALPEITISLLWHASYDHDPAHRWLRDMIIHLATAAMREEPDPQTGRAR